MNVRIQLTVWLAVLGGLAVLLALALPGSTGAASFSEVATLLSSDVQEGDWFGSAVAMDGNTAVIGAQAVSPAGAAYIFEKVDGDGGHLRKSRS